MLLHKYSGPNPERSVLIIQSAVFRSFGFQSAARQGRGQQAAQGVQARGGSKHGRGVKSAHPHATMKH
eukprot:15465765-Alexandrium_andersonii.AAC.1